MIELRVRCTVADAPAVAEALTARGWGTLWIDEPLVQHTDDEGYVLDAPAPDAPAVVHAYPTREGASPKAPDSVLGFAVEPHAVSASEAATDWSEAWRGAHEERVELVDGWVLRPPWSAAQPGERAIVIDPGAAFGTGEHPTTRDSLAALKQRIAPGARVLDLGTGSGVLAIAAVLWGAGCVLGVDAQDDVAHQVDANAALNGLAAGRVRVVVADLGAPRDYEGAARAWDVVLCNVGAAEVERALALCDGLLAPGGVVIASGIFAPSRARVLQSAARAGLALCEERDGEGWLTLVFERRAGS